VVIRRWRHANDVTAQQLADRVGMDLRQVQRFEGHEGNPTLDTLIRLSAAMGLGVAELVGALEAEVYGVDGGAERGDGRAHDGGRNGHTDVGSAVANVAHAIRSRRSAREWTQTDLAEHAGLSRSKVQSIETRRHAATLDTLDALADALDCGIVELLGDGDGRARER
jgi:transcriptional regulator with XRE-family HTH domain